MNTSQETEWHELLGAIETYAYGPGEAGLRFLEGGSGEPPETVTATEVFEMAMRYEFDLPQAVRSLRADIAKDFRERSQE